MGLCAISSSNYAELNTAKLACALDLDCRSVVDEGCDGNGPFQLCSKQEPRGGVNDSVCVNKEQDKEGTI